MIGTDQRRREHLRLFAVARQCPCLQLAFEDLVDEFQFVGPDRFKSEIQSASHDFSFMRPTCRALRQVDSTLVKANNESIERRDAQGLIPYGRGLLRRQPAPIL
ncbi:hypothetical protein NGR_b05200 (plasmid) [Sinorhizobium fredii NGR234]|uniref:Uncharacterized protein n=1 Tax=Sinorhizobium fredii (strain NBRC 101917 / NGR234) TaxID=394 RepID=C3KPH1_SINFN|nr:hypothetical protein NGR_b05200 [Sinorhizobium fredii NGR234]